MARRREPARWLRFLFTCLVLAAILFIVYRNLASYQAEPRSVNNGTTLPCASYKEHRKTVAVRPSIPMLRDKSLPAYRVVEVIDGDTITVAKDGRTRVRLMGMDTPERTTTRNGKIEHFGEEAHRFARSLLAESGWEVRLTYDQVRKDKYGRDLAYVWLQDGRMLNAVLVAEGYAYSYSSSPKPEYVDLFLALMREARASGRGLWAACD